jgi:hypothetical protein
VALSIFPDPVSGRYKDAGWQAIGEELKALLTPQEYDSARRTTFNAFYTSPTVIATMHEAISRLGVPAKSTILEPGCGMGNFMRQGREGTRFIGVEMDAISGRIAKALHPEHDIRIEDFRDTKLPEGRIDAVIGNVPFADLKLDYHGQKLSLHDFFFAKSIDALKRGGVLALVATHFTLDKLCDRPHNLSFVVLSVMWRRLKAPVAGPDGACIGRHINEVAAARAHLLTAGRTGYPIRRDAGVCPRGLERASSGSTHRRARPAGP